MRREPSGTDNDHNPSVAHQPPVTVPGGTLTDLATTVASLVRGYEHLDGEINDITTDLLDKSARLQKEAEDRLIPLFADMQSLLSQRGSLRKALRSGDLEPEVAAQLLTQLNDLPGWSEWYAVWAVRVNRAKSLRTVQRELAKLHREALPDNTEDGEETHNGVSVESDHKDEDAPVFDYLEAEREEIKSGAELLTEHANKMLDALIGKSIKNDSMRIKHSLELVKDLQRAIVEGKLFPASPSPQPDVVARHSASIIGQPIPEPDDGTLEDLRQRLSRMADTHDIGQSLSAFLREFVEALLAHHPYAPSAEVVVNVYRAGVARMQVGDWLESRGGDNRLGRVVEVGRGDLKIRWYDDGSWREPRSIMATNHHRSTYATSRVIFEPQAAERHSEAFSCYPADEAKASRPKHEAATAKDEPDTAPEDDSEKPGAA